MNEIVFEIVDEKKRKGKPCALLHFSREGECRIDINEEASMEDVPAFFIPFMDRNERILGDKPTRRWIEERICPPGRQNLGEVLTAHGLNEYDELALLRSSRAKSSQDDFIVREVALDSNDEKALAEKEQQRLLLGTRIRNRREALGLSQSDLARKLSISQPRMSSIEAGSVNLTFDLLADIATLLDLDDLFIPENSFKPLWTPERMSLRATLHDLSPDLEVVYERTVDEIEKYSREDATAVVDCSLISHCIRELLRLLPWYMSDEPLPKGKQNKESAAIDKLVKAAAVLLESNQSDDEIRKEAMSELKASLSSYNDIHAQGGRNSDERLARILRGNKKTPSMALAVLKDVYSFGQERAHLNEQYAKNLRSKEDFIRHLELLEGLLRTQLDSIFVAKSSIDAILKRANRVDAAGNYLAPSDDDVMTAMSIVDGSQLEFFFFRELKNPLWLPLLDEHSAFNVYEKKAKDTEGLDAFLLEPYLRYCIAYDPERVFEILQRLSATGHPLFRRFVLENAHRFPLPFSKALARELDSWAVSRYGIDRYFWDADYIVPLITSLHASGNKKAQRVARKLVQSLIAFDPNAVGVVNSHASCCIPYYQYEGFVDAASDLFAPEGRYEASKKKIAEFIQQESISPQITHYALPTLDPAKLKSGLRRYEYVRPWLCFLTESVEERFLQMDRGISSSIEEVDPIVRRAVFYALHAAFERVDQLTPDLTNYYASLLSELLTEEHLFNSEYEREILPLLCDYSKVASNDELESFLERLSSWTKSRYSRRYEELLRKYGDSSNEIRSSLQKKALSAAERSQQRILAQFKKKALPPAARRELAALDRKYGKYAMPDDPFDFQWATDIDSSIDIQSMLRMGPENLIRYITSKNEIDRNASYSFEIYNLKDNLASLASEHPSFFDSCSEQLQKLDAAYLDSLFCGWQIALDHGKPIPYGIAIELGRYLADVSEEHIRENGFSDQEITQAEIAAARLMNALLLAQSFEPSLDVMHDILLCLILFAATPADDDQADEASEDDKVPGNPYGYCAIEAMNELRPIAISGIVKWLYHDNVREEDIGAAYEVLTSALPTKTHSGADVFSLATTIPLLLRTPHGSRVTNAFSHLFGEEDPSVLQRLALSAILMFSSPRNDTFDLVFPALRIALERGIDDYPSCLSGESEDSLLLAIGQWLYLAVLWEYITIEDSLLSNWFSVASDEMKAATLGNSCTLLTNYPQIDDRAIERVQELWTYHVSHSDDSSIPVQGAFDLYETGRFGLDWIKDALLIEAQTPGLHRSLVAYQDSFLEIAETDLDWAVDFLQVLLDSTPVSEFFRYRSVAPRIRDLYEGIRAQPWSKAYKNLKERMVRDGILGLD